MPDKRKQELIEEFFSTSLTIKRLLEPHPALSLKDRFATMLQLHALGFLREQKEVTVGSLSKHLALSSSSTAQLLDRLIRSGWITRMHDEDDKRLVHVSLTKDGQEKLLQLRNARAKHMEKMTHYIPEEELQTLVTIMHKIASRIKEEK